MFPVSRRNRIENFLTKPVQDPFETFFNSIWSDLFSTRGTASSLELYDNKDSYELVAEVPGFQKENLSISVDRGVLIIKGKTKSGNRERSISRSVMLPEGADPENVKAELKDGVLRLTIGRTEGSSDVKEIPIE